MLKLTDKQCLEIAAADYCMGTAYAIDLLESYGGDCSIYWDYQANLDENYYDYDNELDQALRDQVYELNGIYDQMQKAYEEGWY